MEPPAPSDAPGEAAPESLLTRIAKLGVNSRAATLLEGSAAAIQQHAISGRRGLAVCAAAKGAGVSFVTAGLALTVAQSGLRTLIIDANLRTPALADMIRPPSTPAHGLLHYLRGELDDPGALVQADVEFNLSAIYAGGAGEDVQDLFDTERFEQVMQYALRTYDLTLIDTPPANRCAETRRIAAVAGYAVLVARRDVTMAEDLGTLIKDLRLDRTEIIGSIFNEG